MVKETFPWLGSPAARRRESPTLILRSEPVWTMTSVGVQVTAWETVELTPPKTTLRLLGASGEIVTSANQELLGPLNGTGVTGFWPSGV